LNVFLPLINIYSITFFLSINPISGEYIALGSLESSYVHSPIVENLCVCADSFSTKPVALVVPNRDKLVELARSNNLLADVHHNNPHTTLTNEDYEALCNNKDIKKLVLKSLNDVAKQIKLEKCK
jgi:long-chain acyl-CoA synthetase